MSTQSDNSNLLEDIANYYSEKILRYGVTPQGVDWNGEESQLIRFDQLCKVFQPAARDISVIDLGCGYGALLDYLKNKLKSFEYLGVDISQEMISVAKQQYISLRNARFINAAEPDQFATYGVASGIFNVRLDKSNDEWLEYVHDMLDILDRTCRRGFAFNCLTSYSDKKKMKDYLYYADPCQLFDLCKKRYSRQVALLHDYGLYEFTILVRKAP
jgi:SAM-dependent methyltransferase